jgi:putative ABC transport system substrate-binding protein
MGIVQSFNRPGGNATGVSLFNAVLTPKRLELLRELVPKAASVALLVNPKNPSTDAQVGDVQGAAQSSALKVHVLNASTDAEIDAAYATLAESRADVFLVGADPLFQTLRNLLIALAARYAVPSIYLNREFPLSGGLMSYGVHFPDAYRQAGNYTGRILKGEKVSDLPVVQPTKFELVINLKTANVLGLQIPPQFLARADEVIE